MGRQVRIEYAGAIYHVMSRGNHQQPIFRDDEDCRLFLDTLGEACGRTGWRIHAFVLMGNHYHLLLETPEANLVDGMRWLQGTYTKRFNVRHKEWGYLLQGRYKALVIDGDSGEYFSAVANYVHLNPARIKGYDFSTNQLEDYAWSSYPAYLNPAIRPAWLSVNRVLGSIDVTDSTKGVAQFRDTMDRRIAGMRAKDKPWEADELWSKIRRGWYMGDLDFRDELIERLDNTMTGSRRDSFSGDAAKLHDASEAERIVTAALKTLGLQDEDLSVINKSDARKKVIAWKVRRNTSVRNEWISQRLQMGHASNLSRFVAEVEADAEGSFTEFKREVVKLVIDC